MEIHFCFISEDNSSIIGVLSLCFEEMSGPSLYSGMFIAVFPSLVHITVEFMLLFLKITESIFELMTK